MVSDEVAELEDCSTGRSLELLNLDEADVDR
jgi:hypothetical protein